MGNIHVDEAFESLYPAILGKVSPCAFSKTNLELGHSNKNDLTESRRDNDLLLLLSTKMHSVCKLCRFQFFTAAKQRASILSSELYEQIKIDTSGIASINTELLKKKIRKAF